RSPGAGYKTRAPSWAHHAEDSDHCDCAAADARHRAAIPATSATERARPMVPGGLDGERQLLRTGLRQGASRSAHEALGAGRLARERQLLHPLKVRILAPPGFSSDCKTARSQPVAPHRMITATHGRQFWQRRTNVWRKATNPARAAKRPRSVRVVFR